MHNACVQASERTTQHKTLKVAITITRGNNPKVQILIRIYNCPLDSFRYRPLALEIHIHIPVHVYIIHLYTRISMGLAVLIWM